MKIFLVKRLPIWLCLLTIWMGSLSCNFLFQTLSQASVPSKQLTSVPLLSSTEFALTQQMATATQAILTSPTAVAAPTRPSQAVVVASYCDLQDCSQYTYPGDWANGVYGGTEGVMLVLPGQVWTASDFVGIQQWDPQTGKLVKTIPDTVENDFADIKYDGKQVWAYALVLKQASANSRYTGALYVIDPVQGELVKKIEIPNHADDKDDDAIDFTQIGISPGKVWVKDRLIDVQTFEPTITKANFMIGNLHFAYDGQGQMWIQGDTCFECPHSIWKYDVQDPAKITYTGLTAYPDLTTHENLIMAGGKMWATAIYQKSLEQNTDDNWELLAYDLKNSDKPAIKTDISKEMTGRYGGEILAADNHVIWLAPNDNNGEVYYYDQTNGQLLGSLHVGALITTMQFDGQYLWVMDNEHGLEKIALPWAP